MTKNFFKNNKIFISSSLVISLLLFSIWSHIYQANQIEGIRISGNPPDEIAGGISRVAIGTQTKWTTNLVPSASFTVDLGSAANPVDDYFGGGASFSRNINFLGELKPDDAICSNDQILKKTGANDWDCAADATGSVASNSLNFDEFQNPLVLDTNITIASGTNTFDWDGTKLVGIGSASFDEGFKVGANLFRVSGAGTVTAGLWNGTAITDVYIANAITIDGGTVTWTDLTTYPTGCTNQFVRTIGDTLTCATVSLTADITGQLPLANGGTAANLTDPNDDRVMLWDDSAGTVVFGDLSGKLTTNSAAWLTIPSNSLNFGELLASMSLDTNTSVASGSFTLNWGASFFKAVGELTSKLVKATVKMIMPTRTASNVNETGAFAIDTASISLNIYDGTAERVIAKNEKCFSFNATGTNVTAKNQRNLKKFRDPFTITSVEPIASGTNALGWNLMHGAPGTVTTALFSAAKSASTSTYPIYTAFNDATIQNGNALDYMVTSTSATIDSLGVTVCGRYDSK